MFEYMICNRFDKEIFEKQCIALENNIPDIEKEDFLEDVDGSSYQTYLVQGKKVEVSNSYYLNCVYIKSEIDLEQFFN